jgi:hypothetical protein
MRKIRKQSMKQVTEMMNRTTRRTEEERSNTMERKKWWAGLIAVAVGLAFSVGSALAYEQGDFADEANEGKLIPYYMASGGIETIIGVHNMSDTGDAVILEVAVHNAMGALQATQEICLTENQFGYAVLREKMMMMDDGMMDDGMMMVELMVGVGDKTSSTTGMPADDSMTGVAGRAGSSVTTMPGEGGMIAKEGFVVIRETFTVENSLGMMDACDQPSDATDDEVAASTTPNFATWAIFQDAGDSFFGTEIQSATVTVTARTNADGETIDADGIDCSTDCEGAINSVTGNMTATVRVDNNMMNDSMSTVYLWLDSSVGYVDTSGARVEREVVAMVYCEGTSMPNRMMLPVPDQVNVIDGMDLGCDMRGVAMITLPTADHDAGIAWSHVAQDGGGFRMNFPGYENGPS